MRRVTIIRSTVEWLEQTEAITTYVTHFQQMDSSTLEFVSPVAPTVVYSPVVAMSMCDKNWTYRWSVLPPKIFPRARFLVLNTHPCEPEVVKHLAEERRFTTLVHERWWASAYAKHVNRGSLMRPISAETFDSIVAGKV